MRHSKTRDAGAIQHHYDVSNTFYEWVLGPSMTYTCAVYPHPDATLEEAQENKYRLVFEKLRLKPGDRLLDVGCGWGGMVRYAARHGVKVIGVTLSKEQAAWAQDAIDKEGLGDLAEVRHSDYRDVREAQFDAVSSIGLTEHVGVANYPAYFRFLKTKLRTGGLMLNHCITRHDNSQGATAGGFIDRYVFPDGELTGAGRIITEVQDVGLEVVHEENLRHHYALTLRDWCRNLVERWDEAVDRGGSAHRQGVGSVHGRVPGRLRAERDSAAPSARGQTRRAWWRRRVAVAALVDRVGTRLTRVIRFLLRVAVFLGSSAIGLLVAAWLVPGVSLSTWGFITAVVIFTVAQAILSPFFLKMASRYASAFLGGIGLVSTYVALLLASLLSNGLSIRGIGSWIAATVVVWLVTAVATVVLPVLVLREKKKAA